MYVKFALLYPLFCLCHFQVGIESHCSKVIWHCPMDLIVSFVHIYVEHNLALLH